MRDNNIHSSSLPKSIRAPILRSIRDQGHGDEEEAESDVVVLGSGGCGGKGGCVDDLKGNDDQKDEDVDCFLTCDDDVKQDAMRWKRGKSSRRWVDSESHATNQKLVVTKRKRKRRRLMITMKWR